MGTNYHLHGPPCCVCDRDDPPLHIGKSSVGWCFTLHIYPDRYGERWGGMPFPKTLDDWRDLFSNDHFWIEDEYGRRIGPPEMLETITRRAREREVPLGEGPPPPGHATWAAFLQRNYAEVGPGSLLRFRVGEAGCVGHGDGPWDLMEGYFS